MPASSVPRHDPTWFFQSRYITDQLLYRTCSYIRARLETNTRLISHHETRYLGGEGYFGTPRDIYVARDTSGPLEISTWRGIFRDPSRYLRGEGYFGTPRDIYVVRDISWHLEISTWWRIFRDPEISQCHMFPFFQKLQRLHESEIWPALTCWNSTWHEYLRSHTKPI